MDSGRSFTRRGRRPRPGLQPPGWRCRHRCTAHVHERGRPADLAQIEVVEAVLPPEYGVSTTRVVGVAFTKLGVVVAAGRFAVASRRRGRKRLMAPLFTASTTVSAAGAPCPGAKPVVIAVPPLMPGIVWGSSPAAAPAPSGWRAEVLVGADMRAAGGRRRLPVNTLSA